MTIRRDQLMRHDFPANLDSFVQEMLQNLEKVEKDFSCFMPGSFGKYSYPKANVVETSDAYVIHAAVPGLEMDDISIEVRDKEGTSFLALSGKKVDAFDVVGKVRLNELKQSAFTRLFYFEQNMVLWDKISAALVKGVLRINIPKRDVTPVPPAETVVSRISIE
jgi:HSP20 family molecular chaperone IbpA